MEKEADMAQGKPDPSPTGTCNSTVQVRRNCDVYRTEREAREAFYRTYFGPTEQEDIDHAFIGWLFMEYEG